MDATQRYKKIAEDIAAISLDEGEPPLFSGERGRERTALVLAALAFEESALRRDVDRGECRKGDPLGDSDSCHAFSIWQVHADADGGIVLDGPGLRFIGTMPREWQATHANERVRGEDLLRDRRLAARVALHLARVSIANWTTAPRAKRRAQTYFSSHPYR